MPGRGGERLKSRLSIFSKWLIELSPPRRPSQADLAACLDAVASDRDVVVERVRDRLGDPDLCFGYRSAGPHAPPPPPSTTTRPTAPR